jgi:hypothetical protein
VGPANPRLPDDQTLAGGLIKMSALDDRRRLEEIYLPSADDFVLVDVPDLQFVMIDGEGDPGGEVFA